MAIGDEDEENEVPEESPEPLVEEDDGAAGPRPYDPEKIRVEPKSFSLRQILDMIDDGEHLMSCLNMSPMVATSCA